MDKYRRYYGIIAFLVIVFCTGFFSYKILYPALQERTTLQSTVASKESELSNKRAERDVVANKIKKLKDMISGLQKKVYSPTDSDLGNDTLFFTLYNDLIEMIHSNSVKIKSLDYSYNPESDSFVKFGKDTYFVCEVNMELVSNYINLGKLIQDIYQYPYYIKINNLEVKPYEKDKKILISKMKVILYAHTSPEEEIEIED